MLQNIRETMSGPVAWFIVGLITLPFAFWGVDQFNTGGADPVLVEVGDQEISQSQFQRAYQQRYQQLAAMLGERFSPDMIDQQRFQVSVMEDLINEYMLRQFTRDAGYRIPDAALFDFIKSVPAFQEDGRFSTEAYKRALANQGLSPASWEERLRSSLEIEQMRRGILESAFVTPAEAQLARRIEQQQRYLSYVRFKATDYTDAVTVTDEEIQAWYEENRARFMAPERVKLAYLDLDADKLAPGEAPAQEVLKAVYEAERDTRFTIPEERRASHILIKFGSDKEAARKRLQAIRDAIAGGADFAEQARQHSEDPGSREQGGSLGWIRRGQMVESFEQVLFSLGPGELSPIVETEYGWHLIRVDEIRPATVKPFDDPSVQRELLEMYRAREAERRFAELAEQLEQVSFESPDSLQPAAEATGLTVQTTDWFGRSGGTGIAANDEVREAAFSATVMDGENSRPISLGPHRLVVVRQAQYEPARQRELSEVRTEIHAQLLRRKAAEMAREKADAVMAAVEAGASLSEAAAEVGGEVKAQGLIGRDNTELDRAIVERLFTMPRPADGKSRFARVDLPSGDAVVLALSAVQYPEGGEPDASLVQRLREAQAGAEFSAYRAWIREQIEVDVIRQPVSEVEG